MYKNTINEKGTHIHLNWTLLIIASITKHRFPLTRFVTVGNRSYSTSYMSPHEPCISSGVLQICDWITIWSPERFSNEFWLSDEWILNELCLHAHRTFCQNAGTRFFNRNFSWRIEAEICKAKIVIIHWMWLPWLKVLELWTELGNQMELQTRSQVS